MFGVSGTNRAGASGTDAVVSTSRRGGAGRDVRGPRGGPSKLDPGLSLGERERRHRLAPLDKRGALTKPQREAFWAVRDLVTAATDKGVSRRAIAAELQIDESYLDGLLAPGDTRMPSAAHLVALLMSTLVPESAKRIVLGQMGVLAGVVSHVKAGGLAAPPTPAEVAMHVAAQCGELFSAIGGAVDPTGDGGAAITQNEAKEIRREAGEAAIECEKAGVVLGGRVDVRG